jgi:hypothetical protein
MDVVSCCANEGRPFVCCVATTWSRQSGEIVDFVGKTEAHECTGAEVRSVGVFVGRRWCSRVNGSDVEVPHQRAACNVLSARVVLHWGLAAPRRSHGPLPASRVWTGAVYQVEMLWC